MNRRAHTPPFVRHLVPALCFLALLIALPAAADTDERLWKDVVQDARGETVDWYMWGGFPAANAYVNGFVASRVAERYGIRLRQVPVKDIAEVISKVLVEKQAGKHTDGRVDLMWINGENFRTCKRNGLLFGPFARRLPNAKWVNWDNPSVANDFGEPVEGMESPWGSAQVVMIHDTRRTPRPPATMGALLEWIRRHPGRFAYPAPPDFTGSAFVRHVFYHAAGGLDQWREDTGEAAFRRAETRCYDTLRSLAPFLWRQGKTYPENPIRLHQLFADGEVDFSFSYHQAEASKNIHDGLFPNTVRTFVFREGTIANTHFVAIPFNAADKAGAMVVADFLLSPEAQLEKAHPETWGDFPIIDPSRLDAEQRREFANLPRGAATLPNDVLQAHQLPELPSRLLIRLEKGWDRHVLKGR